MKKTLLALAYSDIHKHAFSAFSPEKYTRFEISLRVEKHIAKKAEGLGVPVLFLGDMFHDPSSLENYIIERSIEHYKKNFEERGIKMYAISGNHDMSQKNTRTNVSPTYLKAFDTAFTNFHLVDNQVVEIAKEVTIHGIPYYHDHEYLLSKIKEARKGIKAGINILMLHTDLPGAPTPSGFINLDIPGYPSKIDKIWKGFDIVLSGHIHRPYQLSKICWMLGSPIHQNSGDVGCEMGYWEVYSTGLEFKPLNQFPRFVQLQPGQKENNGKDYFLVSIEPEVEEGEVVTGDFSIKLSPKELVKRYFKSKQIKGKKRKQLLTEILNSAINDNI